MLQLFRFCICLSKCDDCLSIRLCRHASVVCGIVGLLLVFGCNRNSRFSVAPVSGQVTYRGHGVPKAIVIFIPIGETAEKLKKLRPFAYADDDGKFALKTYVGNDGAPLGTYHVSIIANSTSPQSKRSGKDTPPEPTGDTPRGAIMIPPEISKKFEDAETSGIEVTVQPGENNLQPFELKAG